MDLQLADKVAVVTGASRVIAARSRDELAGRIHSGLAPEAAATEMAKSMKPARFGEPSEIAAAVVFLASATDCRGAILDVDGGQTRTL